MLLVIKIIMWIFVICLFVPALIARIAKGKVHYNTYQRLCDVAGKSALWSCRIFFGLCGVFALYISGVGLYHIVPEEVREFIFKYYNEIVKVYTVLYYI